MPPTPSSAPIRSALAAQILGGGVVMAIAVFAYPPLFDAPLALAALQGGCAALIAYRLDAPRWWLPIHGGFLPAAVLASRLDIAPAWYLAAFILLLLVYWRTDKSRVPLYLSNAAAARALAGLLPATPCQVVDLGCGDGSLLRRLARTRPDCSFLGIEHAPLPWLWAKLAGHGMHNLSIRYGDFWRISLTPYNVVYAFLSPAPMAALLHKAHTEMRPGSMLVSNTFAIPDVEPERVVALTDRRATRLHCYRM
ncbi:MAG: methyltransferase type 12 [Betaproteobacteria bacterium]|nr:methyltransferase type 12 [Betaproteobacteria bacterium]